MINLEVDVILIYFKYIYIIVFFLDKFSFGNDDW